VVTVLGWQKVRAWPTGRVWETHFAHVFTLVDGKVARVREFYDTVPIAQAFAQ
jgi:ketosteroid isomerase-like protein